MGVIDPQNPTRQKENNSHYADVDEDIRKELKVKYITGKGPALDKYYAKPDLKKRFEDIVLELSNMDVFNIVGIPPTKTYLMIGPPRTGKTYGVKVLAEELKKNTGGLGGKIAFLQYKIGQSGSKYINMNTKPIYVEVFVDWNDEKSIKKAEKRKTQLENQGYKLKETNSGIFSAKMIYVDPEQVES